MLQPNTLIFPKPVHQNLDQTILFFNVQFYQKKKELIFISKSDSFSDSLYPLNKQQQRGSFEKQFLLKFNQIGQFSPSKQIKGIKEIPSKKQNRKSYHKLGPVNKSSKKKNIGDVQKQITKQNENEDAFQQLLESKQYLSQRFLKSQKQLLSSRKIKLFSSIQTTARSYVQICEQKKSILLSFRNTSLDLNLGNQLNSQSIPCILIRQNENFPDKILVYYHANGQDIINCYNFAKKISTFLNYNVLVVEYPGYSIYKDSQAITSQKIIKDIPIVMSYLNRIGYSYQNIVVIGRSIGTGPATYISANYNIGGLILLSPFTSFKQVVENLYGKVASLLTKQIFNNYQICQEIKCPVLILHGLKDKVISYQHSVMLSQKIKTYCTLIILPNMTHNKFNYQKDFLVYVEAFLQQASNLT